MTKHNTREGKQNAMQKRYCCPDKSLRSIHEFPQTQMWPFDSRFQNCTVIASPQVLLVCCTLLLLLYHLLHDMYLMYQRHFPPGPLSLPLIGNLHLISPRLPHLSLQRLGTKYGKIFSLRMGHMGRVVFVQDIDHINQVRKTINHINQIGEPINHIN